MVYTVINQFMRALKMTKDKNTIDDSLLKKLFEKNDNLKNPKMNELLTLFKDNGLNTPAKVKAFLTSPKGKAQKEAKDLVEKIEHKLIKIIQSFENQLHEILKQENEKEALITLKKEMNLKRKEKGNKIKEENAKIDQEELNSMKEREKKSQVEAAAAAAAAERSTESLATGGEVYYNPTEADRLTDLLYLKRMEIAALKLQQEALANENKVHNKQFDAVSENLQSLLNREQTPEQLKNEIATTKEKLAEINNNEIQQAKNNNKPEAKQNSPEAKLNKMQLEFSLKLLQEKQQLQNEPSTKMYDANKNPVNDMKQASYIVPAKEAETFESKKNDEAHTDKYLSATATLEKARQTENSDYAKKNNILDTQIKAGTLKADSLENKLKAIQHNAIGILPLVPIPNSTTATPNIANKKPNAKDPNGAAAANPLQKNSAASQIKPEKPMSAITGGPDSNTPNPLKTTPRPK